MKLKEHILQLFANVNSIDKSISLMQHQAINENTILEYKPQRKMAAGSKSISQIISQFSSQLGD
jgi:hypothetical protein